MRLTIALLVMAAAAAAAPSRVEENIARITRSVNAQWGIYVKCLETGEEIAIDADRQMDTMSTIKIPLMVEVISTGKAVRKEASDQMLRLMRGQIYSSRLPKYVTGYTILHKTGDFLPYIANDVGVFESEKRHVVVCVFTAHHYGVGAYLED